MASQKQIDEDIAKANSWANWSFSGIFIPIAGWIMGGMSLSKLGRYRPVSTQERLQFSNIRSKAWWGIVLSTVTLVISISFTVYNNRVSNQLEQQAETERHEQLQLHQSQLLQQQAQQNALDTCLQKADDDYWAYVRLNAISINETDNTVRASQATWDTAESNRKNAKDECYRRASFQ